MKCLGFVGMFSDEQIRINKRTLLEGGCQFLIGESLSHGPLMVAPVAV